jgi:hypothetical protein
MSSIPVSPLLTHEEIVLLCKEQHKKMKNLKNLINKISQNISTYKFISLQETNISVNCIKVMHILVNMNELNKQKIELKLLDEAKNYKKLREEQKIITREWRIYRRQI